MWDRNSADRACRLLMSSRAPLSARPPTNWRRSWAERSSELAVAQHLDDGAEVLVGMVGCKFGIDLGGVAAQRCRRTGRVHRVHRQAQVLVHQRGREAG